MSTDLRKYARQTNIRLFIGFIIMLLIIGDGVIFLIYGRNAALAGVVCILAGLFPLLLIYASLYILEQIAKKADDE
ncbi:MAG: hypothetical protein N2C13_00475 [Chloroflexota bacterium]